MVAPRYIATGRRLGIIALVALAAAGGLYFYGGRHDYTDLRVYYGAVRWWADGHPLYDFTVPDRVQGQLGFTYPPFAALLMYPMSWVSLYTVIVAMWLTSAAAVAATTAWLVLPVADRRGWPRWYALCLAIPLVVVLEPVRETFSFGQINLILALLVLADLLKLVPAGSRWAGVGVGLAAAIKLTPGIFIVYLLLRRRFRVAARAAGTAVAATLLVPVYRTTDSVRYWTSVVWQAKRVGRLSFVPNQSLLGALSRLAYPHDASRFVWVPLAATALCLGLWRAVRVARSGDEVAGLALAGFTGALVSPVSWAHHLYWFVPALIVLLDTTAHRRWYLGLAALVWLSLTFSVIGWYDWRIVPQSIMYRPVGQLIDDWYLLLMLGLLVLLPARGSPAPPPPVGRPVPVAATRSPV